MNASSFYDSLIRWIRRYTMTWSRPAPLSLGTDDPRRDTPSSGETAIRLFVSSTFQDLQSEREILRRDVFPFIQRFCEDRGVSFFEIDLRWGVTRSEAESQRVLSICFEEIDRCRPYVLGLIGRRYGWIDPNAQIVLDGASQFRQLRPYAECSVTELELRYSILNRPPNALNPLALVYRRPAGLVEHEDVKLGAQGFANLATELNAAGFRIRATPENLDEFAKQVRDDLIALIAARLPIRPLSMSKRARAVTHDVATALGVHYVDLPATQDILDLVRQRVPRIAIVGAAGTGKSTIAAALFRALQSDERVATRVVAALGPAGWSNWSEAFENIIAQMQDTAAGTEAKTSSESSIYSLLHDVLGAAAEHDHVVAIVDGIDDDNISAAGIPAWCPAAVVNATIVVTLRGQIDLCKVLRRDDWNVVGLAPLSSAQTAKFSEKYFAPYGKRLDAEQISLLAHRPRSALEVALMLDELRAVPRFEDLAKAVSYLAGLADISALLDVSLDRIYIDRGETAEVALAALALAPDGLSESVLQAIAGQIGKPLARLEFSLLSKAIGGIAAVTAQRVILRSNVFAERILRRLPDRGGNMRRAIITRLRSDLTVHGAAEELLRQLLVLGRWSEIADILADRATFDALTRRARQQLRAYWSRVCEFDRRYSPAVYRDWIGTEPPWRVAEAAVLADDLGHADLASELARDAVERARRHDPGTFAIGASVLSGVAERRGEFAEAVELLEQIDTDEIRAVVPQASAVAALRRARIELVRSGPEAATRDLKRAEAAIDRIGDESLNAARLDLHVALALQAGDWKTARLRVGELLALGERLGDLAILAAGETGMAKVARERGKLDQAGSSAHRASRLAKIVGDNRVLQDALGVAARVNIDLQCLDEADRLIRLRLQITRKIGDIIGELEAGFDQAALYNHLGYAKQAERAFAVTLARARAAGLEAFALRAIT